MPTATARRARRKRALRRSDRRLARFYLAGLLLVAARFLAGAVRTARMVRQARPALYAQRRGDNLRRASASAAPCTSWKIPPRPCP